MSVWIEELKDSFLIFGLLTFVLVVPWIHRQYARFGVWRGWPAVVSAITILYFCGLLAFTTFPFPDTTDPNLCSGDALRSYWQLTPFSSLGDVTSYAASNGWIGTLTSGVFLQVFFNVVFFVPLGFLLAYRWRRNLLQAAGIALLVSLLIETTQGTGIWGLMPCPYRLADVDDLMTNTLGGVIGWIIGFWLGRFLPSPDPIKSDDFSPPTRRRIALANAMDIYTFVFAFIIVALVLARADLDVSANRAALIGVDLALSFALFVLIPGLRKDKAGPGIAAANLVPLTVPGERPAGWIALLIRWALWWIPYSLFGVPALLAVVAIDAIAALARKDRRGIRSILARTRFATRAEFDAVTVSRPS